MERSDLVAASEFGKLVEEWTLVAAMDQVRLFENLVEVSGKVQF